jgi:hypothetical protein
VKKLKRRDLKSGDVFVYLEWSELQGEQFLCKQSDLRIVAGLIDQPDWAIESPMGDRPLHFKASGWDVLLLAHGEDLPVTRKLAL